MPVSASNHGYLNASSEPSGDQKFVWLSRYYCARRLPVGTERVRHGKLFDSRWLTSTSQATRALDLYRLTNSTSSSLQDIHCLEQRIWSPHISRKYHIN
jgi:hypothetical protein